MPLDAARWQIDLLAADRTAQAFNSVNQRMKQTQQQATVTASTMSSGFSAVAGMAARLSPILLAVAAAQKVWDAGMKAADLGEQAEQLGLTTDQLQAYRFAAAQAGIGNEQLDTAMTKLTRSIGAAGDGSDEMIAKFDKLGVKLLDGEGRLRKVSAVAPEVARGLLAIESETERNALMMDLFGKSGMKMVTVLGDLAKGNDALVETAKKENALIAPETIKAWDDLSDKLKAGAQRFDTLVATLGKPIAIGGLIFLNTQLAMTAGLLEKLGQAGKFVGKATSDALEGGSSEDLIKRQETIKASMEVLKDSTDALDVAKLAGYRQELERISNVLAGRAKVYTLPPAVITGDSGGKGRPTGNAAAKAGQSAADALAKAQRAESEKAYKEILDNIDRVMKAGEAMTERFGNGAETLTRKLGELDEMLLMGAISTETYDAAVRDLTKSADDQNRAFIGAQGGFDAYIAGFDQGIADMQRANSEFEIGKKAVDFLGDSIEALAGISGKSFGEVAINFALMIAKMEAARAASQVWSAIGGFGGLLSAIGLGGAGAGSIPTIGGGIMDMTVLSAGGGPLSAGQRSIVGEDGPELFVPNTGGNILNRRQLDALGVGGGGDTIVIHQTVNVGQYVTSTEYRRGLEATRRAAEEGAQAAMIARRRSGEKAVKGAFL